MLTRFLVILTIIAAISSAWAFAPEGTRWMSIGLGLLLITLSVIDLRTFTLPDVLNAGVLLLGGLMVWLVRPEMWLHHVLGALIGYGVLVVIETAYRALRGRDGLGRGDAKLLGALGMWTGWAGLAPILLLASMSGLLTVLILSLLGFRKQAPDAPIAFGPFIALGGWVVWLGAEYVIPAGLY